RRGGQLPPVQQAEAEAGQLEGEALPAAALPSFGGWGRRAGAHRGDHPIPFAGADPDEAAPLYDVDAPVPQGCVDIQLAVMVAGGWRQATRRAARRLGRVGVAAGPPSTYSLGMPPCAPAARNTP